MNMVKHYRASTSEWLSYSNGTGDLVEIEDGKGYWIDMASSSTLSVTGVKMSAGINHSPDYKVFQDWNLIGFKSVKYLKSSDYLQTLSGDDHILLNEDNQKKNKDWMKPGTALKLQ